MAYEEPADPLTGKSKRHQRAAQKHGQKCIIGVIDRTKGVRMINNGVVEYHFETIPYPETRKSMLKHGFKWNPIRKIWTIKDDTYFRSLNILPKVQDFVKKTEGDTLW